MSFSLNNIGKNWKTMKSNPKVAAQFQYKAARYAVIGLCCIIGWQFISLFFTLKGGSIAMGTLTRVFALIVGVFIVWQIYSKFMGPIKKMLNHYDAAPIDVESRHIDVAKEVNDIFANFDSKKKMGEQLT